jgi:hypothetical protein
VTDTTAKPKRTGSRKALNAANLEALGAARLAGMLMEVGADYPAVKRLLRLELAGEVGAAELAAEIAKRLDFIEESRARVHWRRYKEFVRDLDLHRRAIAGRLAELDPTLALSLLVRFVGLQPGIMERANDAKGEIEAVLWAAVSDAAEVAPRVLLGDPRLPDQLFDLIVRSGAGLATELLEAVGPSLSAEAIASLRHNLEMAMTARRRPNSGLIAAAQTLADLAGDVDAYIAYFSPSQSVLPPIGARIARRLLKAGRLAEARAALERSTPRSAGPGPLTFAPIDGGEWDDAMIDLLEAEGDAAGAQAARWESFQATLSTTRLRDYLKRLADFDDVEAEEKAVAYAVSRPDLHTGLSFLIAWRALGTASALVLKRRTELRGDDQDLLAPAAQALAERYPAAATLLLRAMILDIVRTGRTEDYKAAQRYLQDAAALGPALDGDDIESHESFAGRIARRWA